MRVLVCGGRLATDQWFVSKQLSDLLLTKADSLNNLVIIHGAAQGIDTLAENWAKEWGIPIKKYAAQWGKYGKRAGYLRNQQMLEEGKPDLVIAFPGGAGTALMVQLAKTAGVPVRIIEGG